MIVNSQNLNALRVGFSALFNQGLGQAETAYSRIATTVPSTTRENKYGWLGKLPNLREWVGDRVIHGIAEHDYSIKNVTYELTIGVDRDDIADDNLGVYNPLMTEMGQAVAAQPDQLVFGLLNDGFASTCFDGQNFFDTDHPIMKEDGTVGIYANTDGGSGTPWFLLCTKRAIKPLIFQDRQAPVFTALDNPDDPNVFHKKQFMYGADVRRNVGFGFPQMAWGSKNALNATNYAIARAGIMSMKGDHGRPLGLVPDLLVVPPGLEGAARDLLTSERTSTGATNAWKGTADLLVTPWG